MSLKTLFTIKNWFGKSYTSTFFVVDICIKKIYFLIQIIVPRNFSKIKNLKSSEDF